MSEGDKFYRDEWNKIRGIESTSSHMGYFYRGWSGKTWEVRTWYRYLQGEVSTLGSRKLVLRKSQTYEIYFTLECIIRFFGFALLIFFGLSLSFNI